MPKPANLERQLVDIVRFCREKADLLRTVDPASIALRQRMAHFAHISDRSGDTYVEIGMDARIRIQEWCFAYLQRRDWTHLISVSQCSERIEEAIAHRFFKTRRMVDGGSISKMIHALDASIRDGVRAHRYVWPCHICYGTSPSEFWVGNVRFRPTERSQDDIDAALGSWQSGMESFGERTRNYYKSFGWIADVIVHTSDPAAAKRLSLVAVQTALAVIKVFLGGGSESRIRTAEQQNYLLDRAELHFVGDEPHLTWHQNSAQAPFAPTWWEDLNQGDNALRLRALDQVVRSVAKPSEQTFLKRKYLSALWWFNDASIDTYAGSRIAKFVTVLEVLTGCNERDELAEAVGERVAYLFGGWPDEGTQGEIKAKVKRIYAVRSELLHGGRDPIGLELGLIAADAGHLAHMTLIAFLDLMIHLGIDRPDYDNSRLAKDFLIIKANIQRMQSEQSTG